MDDLIKRQDALKVSSMDSGIYIGINNLPSVDAVEVVRCEDCKNRFKMKCPFNFSSAMSASDMDFCSMGERETDE